MTRVSEIAEHWSGLCRKAPRVYATPAAPVAETGAVLPAIPDGSGPVGRPGRVRDGIGIAAASLKALVRDRMLLWFAFLPGLIMLFLVLADGWSHRYIDPTFPATVLIWDRAFYLDMQYLWVGIPLGDTHVIFHVEFFLIELACIFGFIIVLASLILYQRGNRGGKTFTFRGALSELRASLGSLAALSVGMALIATIVWESISQSLFFGSIISSIMQLFWLPYAYYEPQNWTLGAIYYSASFSSLEIMAINILLFLAALYLVPAIVLEKRGLVPALATSLTLLKQTWRMVLGCFIVFGLIAVGVFAVGVLIGQSPALLNHDYDFFISRSRGYLPMMAVCYGFIIACWALMAVGFSAAGVAVSDLYEAGKGSGISARPEGCGEKPGPVS